MKTAFFVRHAESTANVNEILASQLDYPLSERGHRQSETIATAFLADFRIDHIYASPLLRAIQTAEYFQLDGHPNITIDQRLIEQNLGRFAGLTYEQINQIPEYQHDRGKRWDWIPEGGGESYRMVAERVRSFLEHLWTAKRSVLICTHAVTLRLIYSVLTASEPAYPLEIAKNGEIWQVTPGKIGKSPSITVLDYGEQLSHKE